MYQCLRRFSVELEETELRSRPVFTAEQQLRTVGLPAAPRLLPAIFTVGYRWDPLKKVSDLRTASIKFPRASVTHPSCLDYIQVHKNLYLWFLFLYFRAGR